MLSSGSLLLSLFGAFAGRTSCGMVMTIGATNKIRCELANSHL